jgi:type IV secretory pathway VirB2 component (pilin)
MSSSRLQRRLPKGERALDLQGSFQALAPKRHLFRDLHGDHGAPLRRAHRPLEVLQTPFTGSIATGLALVAIVVGELMFAFGEGAAKRTLAGVIFGVGMPLARGQLYVLALSLTSFPLFLCNLQEAMERRVNPVFRSPNRPLALTGRKLAHFDRELNAGRTQMPPHLHREELN